MASLPQRFKEATSDHDVRLSVASTPRIVAEDLPECIKSFCDHYPRVRFSIHEVGDEHVTEMVSSGEVDLGLTGGEDGGRRSVGARPLACVRDRLRARRRPDHPRNIHWRGAVPSGRRICAYPLVNALDAFPDPAVMAVWTRPMFSWITSIESTHFLPQRFADMLKAWVWDRTDRRSTPSQTSSQPAPADDDGLLRKSEDLCVAETRAA